MASFRRGGKLTVDHISRTIYSFLAQPDPVGVGCQWASANWQGASRWCGQCADSGVWPVVGEMVWRLDLFTVSAGIR